MMLSNKRRDDGFLLLDDTENIHLLEKLCGIRRPFQTEHFSDLIYLQEA